MYDPTMTLREEDYIEYLALRHYASLDTRSCIFSTWLEVFLS